MLANKYISGTTLISLLLSISIGVILLQILLYMVFMTSKAYYKFNTEINFIQDIEILKQHLSNDFKGKNKITICTGFNFSCFSKLPEKIRNKMLQGNIAGNATVVLIEKKDQPSNFMTYYLEGDKIMRDDITNPSVAIIGHTTKFIMEEANANKYYLYINLSDVKNTMISCTKKIFVTHENSI